MFFWGNRGKTNKLLYVVTLNNSPNGIRNSPPTSTTFKNSGNNNRNYSNYSQDDVSPTKGKIAIITGDAKGIGLSIAEQLLKAEAETVIIGDILSQETKNETFRLNKKYGEHKAVFQPTDVTNPKDLEKLFNSTNKRFGKIGIVVNNAGILSIQNQEQIVDVNIKSLVNGTCLGFQYMSGTGGIIINNALLEGLQPMSTFPLYSGASQFIIGFTKSMSHNYFYNATGVKVMAFCPGPRETQMLTEVDIDNNMNEQMLLNLENKLEDTSREEFIQMSETVAKGVISMLHDGENGSIWIPKNCKFYKIQVPDFKNLTPTEIKMSQKSSTNKILSEMTPKCQTRSLSSNSSKTDTCSNQNKSAKCKSSKAEPKGGINCKDELQKKSAKSTRKICIKFGCPNKRKIICKVDKHMCEKLKDRKAVNKKLPCVIDKTVADSHDESAVPKCLAADKKQKGSENKSSKKYKKDKCGDVDPCKSKKKKKNSNENDDNSKRKSDVDPCKSKKKKKNSNENDDNSKRKSEPNCKNNSKSTNDRFRRKLCAKETEIRDAKRNYSVCKKSDNCADNEQKNEELKVSVDLKPYCSLKESNYQKRVKHFKCENECSKPNESNYKLDMKTTSTEVDKENCQNQTQKSNLKSTASLPHLEKTVAVKEIKPDELQNEPIMSKVLSNVKGSGLKSSLNETSKSQVLLETKPTDAPRITLVNHIDVGETIGLIPTLAIETESPKKYTSYQNRKFILKRPETIIR
ncbi:unnamed protein product [Diabrotica balteata]|uniref:Alcohol dehydrogenase n=1 Tax=Diabrotica balteata TaxID=107213 RepID=A0A9N9T237_DIABA|nr:unnamed protein product [Diabrotica balteata]